MYIAAALVLGASIRKVDASRDLILLAVPDVLTNNMRILLRHLGYSAIYDVEEIPERYFSEETCPYFAQLRQNQRIRRWSKMYTKLRLWEFDMYNKIVYLDLDCFVLDPLPLMIPKWNEISAGTLRSSSSLLQEVGTDRNVLEKGKSGQHDGFNAGFIVLKPSNATFRSMLQRLHRGQRPTFFGNYLDCTEQAFLNEFFDPHTVTHVKIGRPDVHEFDYHGGSKPPLIHWIGDFCPKPWRVRAPDLLYPFQQKCVPKSKPEHQHQQLRNAQADEYHEDEGEEEEDEEEEEEEEVGHLNVTKCDVNPYKLWWHTFMTLDKCFLEKGPG
jgi:hypothetical protein